MFEVGRLCVKVAGRDAGGKCLVVDVLEKNFVLIDGQVRRRKCNIMHLEPLDRVVKVKKNASHQEVVKALSELDISVTETKKKARKEKPAKKKRSKKAQAGTEAGEEKGGSREGKSEKEIKRNGFP
jgi:large subunit ribosomal protein L14e